MGTTRKFKFHFFWFLLQTSTLFFFEMQITAEGFPITTIISDNYGTLIKVTTIRVYHENINHEQQIQNRIKRDDDSSTKVKPFFSHELGIYVVPAVASEVKKIIKENAENAKDDKQPSSSNVSKKSVPAATAASIPVSNASTSNVTTTITKPTKRKKLFVPNLYG